MEDSFPGKVMDRQNPTRYLIFINHVFDGASKPSFSLMSVLDGSSSYIVSTSGSPACGRTGFRSRASCSIQRLNHNQVPGESLASNNAQMRAGFVSAAMEPRRRSNHSVCSSFWEVGEIDCISSSHEAPKNRSSIDGCRDGCAGRRELNLPCSRSRDSAAGIPSPTGAIGATPVSVKGSTAVVRSERKHCGIIIDGFNGGRALRTTKLPHRNNEFRDPERSRDAPVATVHFRGRLAGGPQQACFLASYGVDASATILTAHHYHRALPTREEATGV